MLGGAFLCFEGAEKVLEKLGLADHAATVEDVVADPAAFEKQRISGAVRTDLILSAEIMAITLNELDLPSWWERGLALALVAFVVTIGVYGTGALIVKMDDVGLYLTKKSSAMMQRLGHFMVRSVPKLLTALSVIGTIAMLWVGGGILVHGTHDIGFHGLYDQVHGAEMAVAGASGALGGVAGVLLAVYHAFAARGR